MMKAELITSHEDRVVHVAPVFQRVPRCRRQIVAYGIATFKDFTVGTVRPPDMFEAVLQQAPDRLPRCFHA